MPTVAKRPCPNCRTLIENGNCISCRKIRAKMRGKTAERGYDQAHRRLRVQCFDRDAWRCMECQWEPALVRSCREAGVPCPPVAVVLAELRHAFESGGMYLEMDHIVPIAQRPDLRLDLDNMATLCKACHSKKTAREDGGFGRAGSHGNAAKCAPIHADSVRIAPETTRNPGVQTSAMLGAA